MAKEVARYNIRVNCLAPGLLEEGVGQSLPEHRMQEYLRQGLSVRESYHETLRVTGASVMFTGITLAIGVVTWVFSPLKFQADVGILLTFLFLVNMMGAILLLPALAAWLVRARPPAAS